jgi:hypothetical protein
MEGPKQRQSEAMQGRDGGLTTAELAGARPPSENQAARERARAQQPQPQQPMPAAQPPEEHSGPLFSKEDADRLRNQWDGIQAGFIDQPRKAVEEADNLVAVTMKRLAEIFADERSKLEQQWDRGDNISTEDLRLAMHRYRSFFHRLLAI